MRVAAAIVVLLSLTVAGCIGGPAAESSEDRDWPTINDPKNFSYDTDDGFHVHDYWGGNETVTVVDGTYHLSWNTFSNGSGQARDIVRFRPPDGDVVPQGTANLSVTVSWEDEYPAGSSYGDVELWLKPANQDEANLVDDDLDNGETLDVRIPYEQADLPHQLISAWEFQVHVRGSEEPGMNNFQGDIHLRVDAHRGLELRPFPPHPDHWGDRTKLHLAEERITMTRFNHPTGNSHSSLFNSSSPHIRPANGTLVPLGAEVVEVTLTHEQEPTVGEVDLLYHGADTRSFTRLNPDETDGDTDIYRIPVTDAMADTPYANASLWTFRVLPPYQPDQGTPAYEGEVTFQATVHKG